MRGKLIAIEGPDGCGKTEQLKQLRAVLDPNKFHFTKEPTNSPVGKIISQEYLTGKSKIDRISLQLLYAIDRMIHCTDPVDGINKHLNDNHHVITDRYDLSTIVYAACTDDPDTCSIRNVLRMIDTLTKYHTAISLDETLSQKFTKPDLTIILLRDPDDIIDSLKQRNELSVFETEGRIRSINKLYREAADKVADDSYRIINVAGKSIMDVHHEIMDIINTITGGKQS